MNVKPLLAKYSNSPKILRILATDKDWQIRFLICQNPHTPADILRSFSEEEDEDIRYFASFNSNAPTDILQLFCNA